MVPEVDAIVALAQLAAMRASNDPAKRWVDKPMGLLPQDHWLPGSNFDVEEWDAAGQTYETLAICRTLAQARAVFDVVIAEKPVGRFMIRSRTRVVKRHPVGDW